MFSRCLRANCSATITFYWFILLIIEICIIEIVKRCHNGSRKLILLLWIIYIDVVIVLVFGGKLIGESYTFLKVHVHRNDAEQSGTIPFFSIPRRLWRTMRYRVEDLDHSVLVLVSWRQLHARFLFLNILQYCWENNRTRSFIRMKYVNRMFHFSDRVSIVFVQGFMNVP